eukprot:CAMPEP_0204028912 /NCGR_PEP_ID=MMETSP0360-20130528/53712_1 /ASSEMBLY_ACC=CAM_ASM_000342 /TAXON_ID=268821 /ORGANISM="Scrippsiella Hangoei, Strain SHTV-5" /LENGTH=63 /DNA_ID=CAMNT_0050972797 /DNA_START=21 /DNA_END=208 /DNA_ORIENTATION=-
MSSPWPTHSARPWDFQWVHSAEVASHWVRPTSMSSSCEPWLGKAPIAADTRAIAPVYCTLPAT